MWLKKMDLAGIFFCLYNEVKGKNILWHVYSLITNMDVVTTWKLKNEDAHRIQQKVS